MTALAGAELTRVGPKVQNGDLYADTISFAFHSGMSFCMVSVARLSMSHV